MERSVQAWSFLLAVAATACGLAEPAVDEASEAIIAGTPITETNGVVYLNLAGALCSGTLLSNSWVLTAKHCTTGLTPSQIQVSHEDASHNFGTPVIPVGIFEHPSEDAALLQIPTMSVFGGTATLSNVLAVQDEEYFDRQDVTCMGYGSTSMAGGPNGSKAGKLNQATPLFVSTAGGDTTTVEGNSGGQVPWHGDSGGPCFYDENGYRYLMGVIQSPASFNGQFSNHVFLTPAPLIRDWADYTMSFIDESLGGGFHSAGAIAAYGENHLDVIGRGLDDAMWEAQWTGSWSGWQSIAGTFTSDPGLARASSTSVFAVGRGAAHDVIVKSSFSSVWNRTGSWKSLGGNITTDPTIVTAIDGPMFIFARGTDNALWYRMSNTSGWADWQSLGGSVTSDPSAASMASGVVHVFYRNGKNNLEYKWYSPSTGWSGANVVDSTKLAGAPAVTSSAPSRLDVFIPNTDGTIGYRKWYGQWARTWANLGYSATSNISVASWGTGRMDVVFRGPSNEMRHFAFGG